MASRRFIQRFDRLTVNAQRHLEEVTERLHDMGFTQTAETPSQPRPVLAFPAPPIRSGLPQMETRPAVRRRRQLTVRDVFGSLPYKGQLITRRR